MMSRTHIAVGIATSLAVLQPSTAVGCLAAVAGGAVGGIICDVDAHSSEYARDARQGQAVAAAIVATAIAIDLAGGYGFCARVVERMDFDAMLGVAGIAATGYLGSRKPHRAFAHSLLALGLYCIAISLVAPTLVAPFALGFASHIVLDLLNKQPVQVLFPLKSGAFCLGICRADGTANRMLAVLGTIAAAGLLAWRIAMTAGWLA